MLIAMPWRDIGCEWRRQAHDYAVDYWSRFGVVVEADAGGELFSRADSLNQAVRASTESVVVAVDADMLIPEAQIAEAVRLAEDSHGMVVPFDEARYLGAIETRKVYGGVPPWLADPQWRFRPQSSTPCLGGCNVLSMATLDAVGGWPTGFAGWGCEDLAFADACSKVAPVRRVSGPMVHLHHPKGGDYVAPQTLAANAYRLAELRRAES